MKCVEDIEEDTKKLYGLKDIIRFNNIPRIRNESVIEHTGFVVLFVERLSLVYNFDREKAIRMAVIHDIFEAHIGDMPRNIKNRFPKLALAVNEAEESIIQEQYPEYVDLMREFDECKTIEAKIVKLADVLSVVRYAEVEVKLGSEFYMPEVIQNATPTIERLKYELEKVRRK